MDPRDNPKTTADDVRKAAERRPAPGSKPGLRVFIPYLLVGAVILVALLWIFVLGPSGETEDRGDLLRPQENSSVLPQPTPPDADPREALIAQG